MATTYKKLAQEIREAWYAGKPSDDATHSVRWFAEMCAIGVAECVTEDAILNSNQGESTYANNQFISTFKKVPILVDTDGELYSVLPSTPAGLPNGREITSVRIEGNKCMDCVPMQAQSSFAQDLIGIPCGMILFEVNGTKIVFKTGNPIFDNTSTSTIKMVGAVSGDDLLSSDLTIPKNYEGRVWDKVMARLLPLKPIQQDIINDSISNPT